MKRMLIVSIVLIGCLWTADALAETYVINQAAQWATWKYPKGAVSLKDDGSIQPTWFRRNINAVADAKTFTHLTAKREVVSGGIGNAGSNRGDAERIIDGNPQTWWKPRQEETIENWWVEIDLGRGVLATKIRVTFPDTAGARLFREFSVFTSEGARTEVTADVFQFTRVGGTTQPNRERVIEYKLNTIEGGGATGDYLVTSDTLSFAVVQYVRFVAESKNVDAALAEIEVESLGDNVAFGTIERGGSIRAGKAPEQVAALFDGSMSAWWPVRAVSQTDKIWDIGGQWFEWDLGATFWVDELVSLEWPEYFGTTGAGNSLQFAFVVFTSDGSLLTTSLGDRIESNIDYQLLSRVENLKEPRQYKYHFRFPRRKVRYLFYHHDISPGSEIAYNIFEYLLYGGGYPAAVDLTSDFIDLQGAKNITGLTWDGDVPSEAHIEIRSRTGDTLEKEIHYYHKNGQEVSKERWDRLPRTQRLDPVESLRPGTDWSSWSQVYPTKSGLFLSPTPRRYVQFSIALSTDDPQVAPVLRSLSFQLEEALVQGGIVGEIIPREAELDSPQEFTYRMLPSSRTSDRGFNQVLVVVPAPAESISLEVGGRRVDPTSVTMRGDSLLINLPRRVTGDSVAIRFTTRLVEDGTVFKAMVGNTQVPNLWQEVKPTDVGTTTVFLPAVPASNQLIRNVRVTPPVSTPNGDGVNDAARIRFNIVKVKKEPRVVISTMHGAPIRTLEAEEPGVYLWDGRDERGSVVAPGTYLCRIRVATDMGTQTVSKVIRIVY